MYCRKFALHKGDFSQINQNLTVLSLNGYNKFCKDFKVPLPNNEMITVWKKSSINHQPHEFEQFQNSIALLGVTLNKFKEAKGRKREKMLK